MSATWQATKVARNASIPLSGETPLLNRKREERKEKGEKKKRWKNNLTKANQKYAVTAGRARWEKRSEKAAANKHRPEPSLRRCRTCPRPRPTARPRPSPPDSPGTGRGEPRDARRHHARAGSALPCVRQPSPARPGRGGTSTPQAEGKPCPFPFTSPPRSHQPAGETSPAIPWSPPHPPKLILPRHSRAEIWTSGFRHRSAATAPIFPSLHTSKRPSKSRETQWSDTQYNFT